MLFIKILFCLQVMAPWVWWRVYWCVLMARPSRPRPLMAPWRGTTDNINRARKPPLTPLVSLYVLLNSLWPTNAILWYRSGSTLAQVMAWCLTAPSHYLNQCWLTINRAPWNSFIWGHYYNIWGYQSIDEDWNCIFKIALRSQGKMC